MAHFSYGHSHPWSFHKFKSLLEIIWCYSTIILLGFIPLSMTFSCKFPKLLRSIQVSNINCRSMALLRYYSCLSAAARCCHLTMLLRKGAKRKIQYSNGSRGGTKRKLDRKWRMNVWEIKMFKKQISFLTWLKSYWVHSR